MTDLFPEVKARFKPVLTPEPKPRKPRGPNQQRVLGRFTHSNQEFEVRLRGGVVIFHRLKRRSGHQTSTFLRLYELLIGQKLLPLDGTQEE